MSTYYIFLGNPDCAICAAHSGYYESHPGRPHQNCRCEVVIQEEKDCDGDWHAKGAGGPRKAGRGMMEQDFDLDVDQPDGTVDSERVTVSWPDSMTPEEAFDTIEAALEDKARENSEKCPPFLCV